MHRHQLPNEVAFSFSVTIKMEQLVARVDCFDLLMLILRVAQFDLPHVIKFYIPRLAKIEVKQLVVISSFCLLFNQMFQF